MRSGKWAVFGVMIIVGIFLFGVLTITCSYPYNRETTICQPLEPIFAYIETLIYGGSP